MYILRCLSMWPMHLLRALSVWQPVLSGSDLWLAASIWALVLLKCKRLLCCWAASRRRQCPCWGFAWRFWPLLLSTLPLAQARFVSFRNFPKGFAVERAFLRCLHWSELNRALTSSTSTCPVYTELSPQSLLSSTSLARTLPSQHPASLAAHARTAGPSCPRRRHLLLASISHLEAQSGGLQSQLDAAAPKLESSRRSSSLKHRRRHLQFQCCLWCFSTSTSKSTKRNSTFAAV